MSEETYQLTFYGWLSSKISMERAKPMLDELYEYMQDWGKNAIIFEDFSGSFETVELVKDWDEDENEEWP